MPFRTEQTVVGLATVGKYCALGVFACFVLRKILTYKFRKKIKVFCCEVADGLLNLISCETI
jgi:hypothetical protein